MNRGCCNRRVVAAIQALKKLREAELNPDVRRGLQIAIHTLATESGCRITTTKEADR